MKKYSILILLTYSLFLEVYFEKMFPFGTIVFGIILGIIVLSTKKINNNKKGLILSIHVLFHTIKYLFAVYLTFIYLIFIDYLRVSDIVSTMYYLALALILLILVGLDILDIFKGYKNKTQLGTS
jgi:hypothetical protein